MSMDKAIEHGKEHRKPWRGNARSKNFDKTCRNHGSCDYCKFNRLHTFMKNELAAEVKLKEWEGQDVTYYVTYFLKSEDGNCKEYVESFSYFPTQKDINEVGYEIQKDYGADYIYASRGRQGIDGWEDYD